MKTQTIKLNRNIKNIKLIKWSGNFSQLNITMIDPKYPNKTIFLDTHHVNLHYPELKLHSYNKKDLKWWGSLKTQINSWDQEITGYFEKQIEIKGTGYKFELESNHLKLDLGKSHEYVFNIPSYITLSKDKNITKIIKAKSKNKKALTQYLAKIKEIFPLNTKEHGIVTTKTEFKSN